MTLVAAYRHRGTPVVVGDMAITRGTDLTWRSLRKKAYIISPNLAVAWSGSLLVAKAIISSLRASFANQPVTKRSMERAFLAYDAADFGSLETHVIGWLIDEEESCFLWNCLYPKELFYDEMHYEGSGQRYFSSLKGERWDSGGSGLPPSDELVLSAATEVAKARFEESLYRDTWDRTYGVAYDVIILQEGRFRYVPSIAYIGWDYHWDSSRGTGILKQAPVIVKHSCFGDYSIVQEALHGELFDGVTRNYLSRPVFDEMRDADLSRFALSLQSAYYANYFLFREGGRTIFKCILMLQQATSDGPLNVQQNADGAYFLAFDRSELDRIYRTHVSSA